VPPVRAADEEACARARRAAQGVLKLELERQILDAVTVVVDGDLVESIRIQGEVVRAAVGVLKRLVVREQLSNA
jgi:hypothetical protein